MWGESGALAQLESQQKKPPVIPELEDPALAGRVLPVKWAIYDLPCGWEHIVENLTDPAHIEVAHHGFGFGEELVDRHCIRLA